MYEPLPNPLPRFLSTTGGKIAAATVVAAAIGAGIALAKNSAAATTTPAAGGGTTPAPTPLTGAPANFLFNVAYPTTITATPAQVAADLTAAGFTGLLVQPDPTVTDAFIVAASYGPGLPYSAAIQTAITSPPAAGALDFSIAAPSLATSGATAQVGIYNLTQITSLPAPTTVSLVVGQWYSFAVRTSFLQTASNALGNVITLLQSIGFGTQAAPPTYVAPVTMSSPGVPLDASQPTNFDTWNVIAQYGGAPINTPPAAGSSQSVSDLPPVLLFLPSALPTVTAAPTSVPTVSNVMP
jgi:hypothetical protein